MKDASQNVENRLRWLIRGIVVAAIAVFIAILVGVYSMLRKPETGVKTTVLSGASAPAARASSVAEAATVPSPSQTEASAAAAMRALGAGGAGASAPKSVASTPTAAAVAPAVQPAIAASANKPAIAAAAALLSASAKAAAPAEAPPAASAAPARLREKSAARLPSVEKPRRHAAAHRSPPEAKLSARAAANPERAAARPAASREHATTRAEARGTTAGLPQCATAGWYVQMGAFSEVGSVERLARKLRGLGYRAFCIGPAHPKGLKLFYVGAYLDAEAAARARDRLEKQTGTRGIVRRVRGE